MGNINFKSCFDKEETYGPMGHSASTIDLLNSLRQKRSPDAPAHMGDRTEGGQKTAPAPNQSSIPQLSESTSETVSGTVTLDKSGLAQLLGEPVHNEDEGMVVKQSATGSIHGKKANTTFVKDSIQGPISDKSSNVTFAKRSLKGPVRIENVARTAKYSTRSTRKVAFDRTQRVRSQLVKEKKFKNAKNVVSLESLPKARGELSVQDYVSVIENRLKVLQREEECLHLKKVNLVSYRTVLRPGRVVADKVAMFDNMDRKCTKEKEEMKEKDTPMKSHNSDEESGCSEVECVLSNGKRRGLIRKGSDMGLSLSRAEKGCISPRGVQLSDALFRARSQKM